MPTAKIHKWNVIEATKHYLCTTDYYHEMEEGLADFFNSVEELKKAKKCWESCGITEILLDSAGEELSAKHILRPIKRK